MCRNKETHQNYRSLCLWKWDEVGQAQIFGYPNRPHQFCDTIQIENWLAIMWLVRCSCIDKMYQGAVVYQQGGFGPPIHGANLESLAGRGHSHAKVPSMPPQMIAAIRIFLTIASCLGLWRSSHGTEKEFPQQNSKLKFGWFDVEGNFFLGPGHSSQQWCITVWCCFSFFFIFFGSPRTKKRKTHRKFVVQEQERDSGCDVTRSHAIPIFCLSVGPRTSQAAVPLQPKYSHFLF